MRVRILFEVFVKRNVLTFMPIQARLCLRNNLASLDHQPVQICKNDNRRV